MRKHGTRKFTPAHINSVLVETWEDFNLSSTIITQENFKKTYVLLLYLSEKYTNQQDFLADTQKSKG